MAVTYEIRKEVNGKDTLLGTLAFDDEQNGVLRLTGSSAAHLELKAHWEDLDHRDQLMIEVPVQETKPNGAVVRYEDVRAVPRRHADFPLSVVQYMGRSWGYNLSEKL